MDLGLFGSFSLIVCGVLRGAGCVGVTVWVGDSSDGPGCGHRGPEHPGRGGGPLPWAPAHGWRAKHRYRYYPAVEVSFDLSRELNLYCRGNGWQAGARLPGDLRDELGDSVILRMDTSRPYT